MQKCSVSQLLSRLLGCSLRLDPAEQDRRRNCFRSLSVNSAGTLCWQQPNTAFTAVGYYYEQRQRSCQGVDYRGIAGHQQWFKQLNEVDKSIIPPSIYWVSYRLIKGGLLRRLRYFIIYIEGFGLWVSYLLFRTRSIYKDIKGSLQAQNAPFSVLRAIFCAVQSACSCNSREKIQPTYAAFPSAEGCQDSLW